MEAQVCPLVMAIPRFIQMVVPLPSLKLAPHALIDPSALIVAKALAVE
jgi:hypothetical protein